MRVRPLILLFDLDGTLVATSGAGRRALDRAFGELHGRVDACAGFTLAGMTDRAIVRRGLTEIGQPSDERAIDAVIDRYLSALDAELVNPPNFRILDGVVAALDLALRHERVIVGLGTGNVRAGAKRKLDRAQLWTRFEFGGFGDDHEARPDLIRIAAERGAALVRSPVRTCRVVVIGDTALDVAAARANGFEVLAVASGPIARAELEESKPDAVADTLAQREALHFLFSSQGPLAARATSWRPAPKAARRK